MTAIEKKVIDLDGIPYPLWIGRNVLSSLPDLLESATRNRKALIVCDTFFQRTVARTIRGLLEDRGFTVFVYALNAGKGNKNIAEALKIYPVLEENNLARDSTLIALGGGVVSDMAGFIASTWLRGMHLVHIPTTLLAMVDSSIGGKTALNFRNTINGIGSYHQPIANLIDLDLVDSLSDRDYRSGLAEVIKCAIISDRAFFDFLAANPEQVLSRAPETVIDFISRTVDIKVRHVAGDVKEGGKRLLLNYGHTLGHSVEISTEKNNQEQLRHGEGVSVGTAAVAFIAERHLGLSPEIQRDILAIFTRYGLPVDISAEAMGFQREKLLGLCKSNVHKDKKRLNNSLRLILANTIGQAAVYSDVPDRLVEQAFDQIIKE